MVLGPIVAILTAWGHLFDTDGEQIIEMPGIPDGTDDAMEQPTPIDGEIPPIENGGGIDPINQKIRDCIAAGGTFDEQFQICVFPEDGEGEIPINGTEECPMLGELLSTGTRVMIADIPECGVSAGKSGVVTGTTFQRERDRTCSDVSMIVRLDDGSANAFRRSETAPFGVCMSRESSGQMIACGLQPPHSGSGFYYVLNNTVRWVPTANQVLPGGIVIFGAGFDDTLKAWLLCRVLAFPPLGDLN